MQATKYIFRDENGRTAVILGRPIEEAEPGFIQFLSGSGRKYMIRKELILSVRETTQEFKLKRLPKKPALKINGADEQ